MQHNLQCEGFSLSFPQGIFLILGLGSSITSFRKKPESLREVESYCRFFDFAGRDVLAVVVRVNVPRKSLATACVTTEEELGFICDLHITVTSRYNRRLK